MQKGKAAGNGDIIQISPTDWYLKGSSSVLQLVQPDQRTPWMGGNNGRLIKVTYDDDQHEMWSWGDDNLLPQQREHLVQENNIVGELLATKQQVTLGAGLMFYRIRYDQGKEIKEEVEKPVWFRELENRMDIDDYLDTASKNLFIHANVFTEFVRSRDNKVFSIECLEARHTRAAKQDKRGYVNQFYWCGNWGVVMGRSRAISQGTKEDFPIMRTAAYNRDETKPQAKFVLHTCDKLLTDDYYAIPTWWGGRKWVEMANKIPVFHIANLDNGYTIRYHIEMPKDYFTDSRAMSLAKTEVERRTLAQREDEARSQFIQKVNALLAGESNAGRALFTEYELNKQMGKDYPGIKITAIQSDIKDEALLKLFERSNEANISGQGVHPALASIQTQGKLSSGSEIRNANAMFTAIKTPKPRRILTKALNLVRAINASAGEQNIHIGFKDITITNLDENPAGMQESFVEQSAE